MDTLTTTRPLPLADSPLGRTVATSPTDIWNDSCALDELEYAISFGAVGATANPTIVHDVWKKDPAHWRERVRALGESNPEWTEVELAWAVVAEMSTRGARLLEPTWQASGGRKGRLSVQTNPTFFRSPRLMLEQGVGFNALAPNVIVKFPATRAGIGAMEEATYRGVNVNCTVSFSVAQAIAAAEAVERGPGDHDHGRPTRGLAAGADRARRGRLRSAVSAVGRGRGLQARLSALPRAWLSSSAARSGDPAPSPLVGVHRR
jgi:hypothetical protein